MAGRLSPGAQVRLADLAALQEKVHRVHGLVEQFAAARTGGEHFLLPITRTFGQLKMQFMAGGFDAMSQLAGSMEIAARRGLSPTARVRVLREGVGSLRFQVELAQRLVVSEDQRMAASADAGTRPETPPDGGSSAAAETDN
ncbi:hypothetical protein BH23GEM9_BH23GEM9_17890 [soil metagenome]